ncbi:MAG: hypothetical protein FWE86_03915 [Oscillospiraceae bacterium]|nr:hypothetical protein [Oscillospiraceae bacterium]
MNQILPYEIYYENSRGAVVRLDKPPFVAVSGELWNSGWKMTVAPRPGRDGGRLISRKRQSDEKKLRVAAVADSAPELSGALGSASDIFAYDVASMRPGKLWVNGWYLSCYCLAETRELSPDHTRMAELVLTLIAETPLWCSEETFDRWVGESDVEGHKYVYKYPHRYGTDAYNGMTLINRTWTAQPMRITFWGPCSSPSVVVAGREIGIGGVLLAGEYAVIDQQSREIYKMRTGGVRENIFGRRLKNGQVFFFAPPGSCTAYLSSAGNASITVITQKGAPPWSN